MGTFWKTDRWSKWIVIMWLAFVGGAFLLCGGCATVRGFGEDVAGLAEAVGSSMNEDG